MKYDHILKVMNKWHAVYADFEHENDDEKRFSYGTSDIKRCHIANKSIKTSKRELECAKIKDTNGGLLWLRWREKCKL